jgi:hypothetical protein
MYRTLAIFQCPILVISVSDLRYAVPVIFFLRIGVLKKIRVRYWKLGRHNRFTDVVLFIGRLPSSLLPQQDCPSILCCTDGPSRSSDAMNMRKTWVLWTDLMRDSKTGAYNNVSLKNTAYPRCSDHPRGCARRLLKVGEIVKVDATECYLIQGLVWLVAVHIYDRTTNEFKCTVGWVKCLYNQLHLVGNCIAMIKVVNSTMTINTTPRSTRRQL